MSNLQSWVELVKRGNEIKKCCYFICENNININRSDCHIGIKEGNVRFR